METEPYIIQDCSSQSFPPFLSRNALQFLDHLNSLQVRCHYFCNLPVKFKVQLPKVEWTLSPDFFIISVRIDLVLSDRGLERNESCCLKATADPPCPILPASPLYVRFNSASLCNLAFLFLILTLHTALKIIYFTCLILEQTQGFFFFLL